jgi:fumarate reductase flavoprotein subunit
MERIYSRRDFLKAAGGTAVLLGASRGFAGTGEKMIEADVVVCGCGTSGLAAALTAQKAGARVVVFEKGRMAGGTGFFTEGLFAAETALQVAKKIKVTRDQAFDTHMEYSHWRANGRLVRTMIDRSANTIEWLQEKGLVFDGPVAIYPGARKVWHMTRGGGAELIKRLSTRLEESKVPLYLESMVKELRLGKGNRVTGIIVRAKNGSSTEVKAGAVVIATGDFGNNKEMVAKHVRLGHKDVLFANENRMGEGIQMAWAIGAAPEGEDVTLAAPMVPKTAPTSQLNPAGCQPHLWVNQHGERFCNEAIMFRWPLAANAIGKQRNATAYAIFDEEQKRSLMEKGISCGLGEMVPPGTKLTGLDSDFDRGVKEGVAFKADSLDELARKMGLSGGRVKAAVEEYNRCCEQKHDFVFGKGPEYLHAVSRPPLYGVTCSTLIIATLGGIKINEKTEVLDKNEEVIAGLYATGNCAGGLYGDSYDVDTTGGALAFAITSGRIAGESAVSYVKKAP